MTNRQIIAAALLAGAAVAALVEMLPKSTAPEPSPTGLVLRGKFVGPDAADDAAGFAGVCHAVADALEEDGKATSPRIVTGLQLEDVRAATSEFRFQPPLRERQPHVKAVVCKYLDETAGKSGGPIDAATRERWVKAFRDVAHAAEEAVQ